jgi:hypothetical protein
MMVNMYERTNVIEFLYKDAGYNFGTSISAGIGLNGNTSPTFVYNVYASSATATPSSSVRFTPPTLQPDLQLFVNQYPRQINFGAMPTGNSQDYTFTVQRVGTYASGVLTFAPATFGGPGAADYSVIAFPPYDRRPAQRYNVNHV